MSQMLKQIDFFKKKKAKLQCMSQVNGNEGNKVVFVYDSGANNIMCKVILIV